MAEPPVLTGAGRTDPSVSGPTPTGPTPTGAAPTGPTPTSPSAGAPSPTSPASTITAPTAPTGAGELRLRRVLIDTSVLAPEPLWLWMLALTEGIPADQRPQLFVTQSIGWELRSALRRVDPRLTRVQAGIAAGLRLESLTRTRTLPLGTLPLGTLPLGTLPPGATPEAPPTRPRPPSTPEAAPTRPRPPTTPEAPPDASATGPRPHVLDPDDAHLDDAALALDVDALVTDDVHAFAPIPTTDRGYALLSADEFLCGLTDEFGLSIPEAAGRYRAHLARAAKAVGVEQQAGSPSHRLRRSRARRFAKRVVRTARTPVRRGPDSENVDR